MNQLPVGCLVLACGNTLRGDDGVGPRLAEWAREHFHSETGVRVVSRQQWTPELAEEIARAAAVLFIDCSVQADPGSVSLRPIEAAAAMPLRSTHRLGAAELLALASELYGAQPRITLLLTVGAGSFELGEKLSAAVTAALPEACSELKKTIEGLLG